MSNPSWDEGTPGHPAPSRGSSTGNGDNTPLPRYEGWTREPVFYFAVTLRGTLLGYLWASTMHNSASFLRNLPSQRQSYDPFTDPSLLACDVWYKRLETAYGQGMTAQDAVRRWVGVPEDPTGGGIAADAVEGHAESLQALREWANPGRPLEPGPLIQDGTYPDGTPADRSKGWGPLVSAPLVRYPTETSSAVHFSPVTKDGQAVGYVWASVTGEAADYLLRAPAGRAGEVAAGWWQLWLSRSFEAGYTSLQALEYCRNQPEDHLAGIIGPDAPLWELDTLDELKAYARQ